MAIISANKLVVAYVDARVMAECHVRAMRRVQPEGLHRLVGYSAGGIAVMLSAAVAASET